LIGLLSTAGVRFYLKHPWQLCLAVTGIALGVAVYVGVDLANDSARRAFELSENLVLGQVTHQLVGLNGNLPNSTYHDLRVNRGPIRAAPILEGRVELAHGLDRRETLLGVDPLEETGFRGFAGFIPGSDSNLGRLIAEPNTILAPDSLLAELDLQVGDTLELLAANRTVSVQIVGTVRDATLDPSGSSLPLVADIATVQELLGTATLTRIDLVLNEAEAEQLSALPLPGTHLLPATSQNAAFNEISRAFRTNLTALSLLALLVGVFLIYATMSFAIVQRREVFGVLRAVGVSRSQLLLSILLEAAVIGGTAAVLGLILGHLLAIGLVDLVLRTIGDLYFRSSVSAVEPSMLIYWKGLAVGAATTILAALAPAAEASNTPPDAAMSRATLERTTRSHSKKGAWLAIPATALGCLLFAVAPRSLFLGFTGLFMIIVAGALLVPIATTGLLRLADPIAARAFGVAGSLALRGVTASLSRTGVATAALTVAVATVVGVGVMIGSFRISLSEWLDATLIADVYLSAPDSRTTTEFFADSRLAAIDALPQVAGISVSRFTDLPTEHGELNIRAVQPGPLGWGVTLVNELSPDSLSRLASAEGVLISEPYAYRRELSVGDELLLPTLNGTSSFTILGVFRDYITDGGSALMSLDLYRREWNDQGVGGVGVYIAPNTDRVAAREAIVSAVADEPRIRIRSNDMIRERSLEIFDRTFQITEVLRILAGIVAFLGLISALLSIELERSREIAVLRALGLTPRQLGTLALTQTGILGLAAGLLALPLGITMSAMLVFIINQRSFGWSMGLTIEPTPLLLGLALATSAALLAGIYPAVRAGSQSVAIQLRDE
jgi:putative ABC transport system permease protein